MVRYKIPRGVEIKDPTKYKFGSVAWQNVMTANIMIKKSKKIPLNDFEKTFMKVQLGR